MKRREVKVEEGKGGRRENLIDFRLISYSEPIESILRQDTLEFSPYNIMIEFRYRRRCTKI